MRIKTNLTKKIISLFLAITILLGVMPLSGLMTSAASGSTSVADLKTLNDWQNWFPTNSTRYAGGVFLDKSVYTATEAKQDAYFSGVSSKLNFGTDNFGNENFMIALSALGSNSEVIGYSYIPTDTIIVLDASTSMGTGNTNDTAIDDMINGANDAIKKLLSLNEHNRVGVVIYNGTSSVLLPLGTYSVKVGNEYLKNDVVDQNNRVTTEVDFLEFRRASSGEFRNRIYIADNVYVDNEDTGNKDSVTSKYVAQARGTYTQGGFYSAAQEFLKAKTTIDIDEIQGGTKRQPIMVFMSDGQPSYRTKTSSQNNLHVIDRYHQATNTNCANDNFREDDVTALSTMLTAAWAESEISAHYEQNALFYTLGYNLDRDHAYAHNVLDPMNPNNLRASDFASYASQYLAMAKGETKTFSLGNRQMLKVKRASDPEKLTSLDYVDRYWQASGASNLTNAFSSIVDEIVLKSRYYSTFVSGNQYDHDGFISFTDEIGTHMEVKNIKGIYIGEDKLVSGAMFSEFATTGRVSLTGENYTDESLKGFENEIINAICERFSIDASEAALLINTAKESGFISYTNANKFSNYVAWYADKDNKYIKPYSGVQTASVDNAKYIVRSYFYMGDVQQSHVETSMLYALVRVREDIKTGRQIVDMNVPASLLPMATYSIKVEGDTLTESNIEALECTQKKPISLLFEVGLDSEITPYNIAEKLEGQDFRKNQDGTYTFYTNRWRTDTGATFVRPDADSVDPHVFNHGIMNTTVTQFIPSLQNERYYYTANTQILDSNYQVYKGAKPSGNGYFHKWQWIETNGGTATIKKVYNPITAYAMTDENVITVDGEEGWFIKAGTPKFYFGEEVHGEQAHTHKKDDTVTDTLKWAVYPQVVHHISEAHNGYHMLNYLGNNGKVTVTPAQGIKLTKTVSEKVIGADDEFKFTVKFENALLVSSYPYEVFDRYGNLKSSGNATVSDSSINIVLGDGDTAYITDLPIGAEYTVTEKYEDYYVGTSQNATGVIEKYTLNAVDFINSPKGYGSLLVEKDVTHPFGTENLPVTLTEKEFEITVKFTGDTNDLANITAPTATNVTKVSNGEYKIQLKDDQEYVFTSIPEGVTYQVTENLVNTNEGDQDYGFTLKTNANDLSGTVTANTQSSALLVNDYAPDGVSATITVNGEKTIKNRDWDSNKDKYQVALQKVLSGGQGIVTDGQPIIVDIVAGTEKGTYTIDMSSIKYDKVGSYSYAVYEIKPATNPVDGISYDASIGLFTVVVTDENIDGKLEIKSVVAYQETAEIENNGNNWTVKKDFVNVHNSKNIVIPINKKVVNNNQEIQGHSGGIIMSMYESTDADAKPVYSTITDKNGRASFVISAVLGEYATEKYYYIREVAPTVEGGVIGMTYDTEFKYVVSVYWPVGAQEPVEKYYKFDRTKPNNIGDEITDLTAPLEFVNQYDDNIKIELNLSGEKTINGREWKTDDRFDFELYSTDGSFSTTNANANRISQASATKTNKNIAFETVTFTEAGTKYLVAKEVKGTIGGIEYDTTEYHITATVKRVYKNGKLQLSTDPADGGSIVIHKIGTGSVEADQINFQNHYTVTDTEKVKIYGSKTLPERTLIAGEFTFELYENGSQSPITAVNKTDGSFEFPEFTYTKVGTYSYVIKESIPAEKNGITYDEIVYTVTVTLTDDLNGGLEKVVKLSDSKDPNNVKTVTDTVDLGGITASKVAVGFENHYAVTVGDSITLSGIKVLTGRNAVPLRDGEFTFELYETGSDFAISDRNVALSSGKNNANGAYSVTVNYDPQDANSIKTHYYVLEEYTPQNTLGIHYDVTEYYITVNVLDNGKGTLEAHIMSIICPYREGNWTNTNLNFSNRYEASPCEYAIGGTKEYNKTLTDGMFEFVLKDSTGKELERVKNVGRNFSFSAIEYNRAGSYKYTVTETNGGNRIKGIKYDSTEYTVTVTVTDNYLGDLSVTDVKVEGGVQNSIVFNNEYSADATDFIKISGNKELDANGRAIKADEFEFKLFETNQDYSKKGLGIAKDTAKNTESGTFAFEEISFDKADTYYYIVTESKGNAERMTYDETIFGVKIVVADNGEGKLVASEPSYVKVKDNSTEDVNGITFKNYYEPKEANVTLEGNKILEGRLLKEGEFEFELYSADSGYNYTEQGKLETVKNGKDGEIEFSELSYNNDGEYYYVITEKNNGIENVTFDGTLYGVMVKVVTDQNGDYKVEQVVYTNIIAKTTAKMAEFKNVYVEPQPTPTNPTPPPTPEPKDEPIVTLPQTGDNSNLFMWLALLFVSTGGVTASLIVKRKNKDRF